MHRFRLRPEAAWHDGRPVTADDVAFTVEYLRARPYSFADIGVIESVTCPDERTREFRLTNSYAPFPDNVAGTVPILPRYVRERVEDPEDYRGVDAATGGGPFCLVAYDPDHGSTGTRPTTVTTWAAAADELRLARIAEEVAPAALRQGDISRPAYRLNWWSSSGTRASPSSLPRISGWPGPGCLARARSRRRLIPACRPAL